MSTRGTPGVEAFIEEAGELLEQLEEGLLALEGQGDGETVDAVFRALHTIKGSGAMFGFGALADFVHHFEDAFDRVRGGTLAVDRSLIDLSLAARDQMLTLLEAGPQDAAAPVQAEAVAALVTAIQDLLGGGTEAETATSGPAPEAPASPTADDESRIFNIQFKPAAGSLLGGMRPELLIDEISALGQARVRIDATGVPALEALDATACYIAWDIALSTAESLKIIEGVFIFADDADLRIEEVTAEPAGTAAATAADQPPGPAGAVEAPGAPAMPPVRAGDAPRAGPKGEHVRVPAGRLDELMDQLGELVIAQSRLQALAARIGDAGLSHLVEEIDRLTSGLRDTTLSLRMLPIEAVFGKFRRVVRDLSADLGKDVALVTHGGDTEIDKTVIDRLSEPLVHMIRNAMDHGIEDAETRQQLGKSGGGTITLSAWQEGGAVLIAIEDDGKGLDTAAIRRRAEERGLIETGAEMAEQELQALIFAPGFSTAATLSSVSGRGVGMDAVRTAVDALRGKIVVDSTPGNGTRITLSLPVSLAIIDSFLVTLDGQIYVLPMGVVEECVEYDTAVGASLAQSPESGRRMIELRDKLVPYIDLRAMFRCSTASERRRRIVVVRGDGALIGLVVDDILGQAQTVIKSLAPRHQDVGGFSGATILGDGRVALILDVVALSERARTSMPTTPAGRSSLSAVTLENA